MDTDKSLKQYTVTRLRVGMAQIGLVLAALYVIAKYNYLLFHVLSEFISTGISLSIFLLAWNSRKYTKNNYYLFFGMAFLTSGAIGLIHALTYRGMGVVAGTANDSNIATQIWLADQYILAATFLIAPFLFGKKIRPQLIGLGFLAAFAFFTAAILYWKIFPTAYAEGIGLTPFKKVSEYVVAIFFLLSLYFFWRRRNIMEKRFFQLISFTLVLLFISTIAFTLYVGVYSFPNEIGHLLRVLAFYVSYLALVEFGLMKPYHSIFKDLKDKEVALGKALEEWSMTFNSISDPIFILDIDHTIVKANKALLEFLGKSEKEIIGKKCFELMHKQHQPWINCPLAVTKKSGQSHTEEVDDPGLGKVLLVTTSPIWGKFGEIIGIAHIAKDITDRKKMEKAKDEFISLASHQLRTPLSSISLSSELLLRGTSGKIEEGQKEFLEEIYKSTKKMSLLVNNLLNVSRLEMGNFEIKADPLAVSSFANSRLKDLLPLVKEKQITLKQAIEEDIPPILFDENSFGIIFDNFISNALRYTPAGGNISVDLKKEKGNIILKVSDTGCGIPDSQKNKVFEKSFRADNAKEISSEGAGLGLYMVKSIADLTRSKVWLDSVEEKGTTFFFSIPIS